MTATKTHSKKYVILRAVLIAVAAFAVLAAAAGVRWAYNMYFAFNDPVLTGSDFTDDARSLEELDKLTVSDRSMVKKILDEENIPYKESFGTTIFVRSGKHTDAFLALKNSGYEFDGELWG